jgi:hypothetical protein
MLETLPTRQRAQFIGELMAIVAQKLSSSER